MKSHKSWVITFLSIALGIVMVAGSTTLIIDPLFHFHKPLPRISYRLDGEYERYLNNGIVRNFEYDAVITGTSMTENFKSSEFDNIFGVKSVKIPFSGGSFKEINDSLIQAVSYNQNIKYIVRSLDAYKLWAEKDKMPSNFEQPTYLFDDEISNDVSYIFNKDILINFTFQIIVDTLRGKSSDNFDEYANWMSNASFGKAAVDKTYDRSAAVSQEVSLTEDYSKNLSENVQQNVIELAKDNPQIEFYYFFPPYSIYWWDSLSQSKTLNQQIQAFEKASEMILEYDNIHLFSFFENYELICDLDNYKDTLHYGEWVNSQILEWMYDGDYQLTKENCKDYWKMIREFYEEYDYDELYE